MMERREKIQYNIQNMYIVPHLKSGITLGI